MGEPNDTAPGEQTATPDYDSMSDEQLDALLTEGEPPEQEPEPEPEQPVETETESPEPEDAAPAETTDQPEAVEEEDPADVATRLRFEELELHNKKLEAAAQRRAGEVGYLRQQLTAMQTAPAPVAGDPDESTEVEIEPERRTLSRPEVPVMPTTRNSQTDFMVDLAIERASREFAATNPDAGDMGEDIKSYILEKHADFENACYSQGDPAFAMTHTTRTLEEAYYHAKHRRVSSARKDAEEKRAAQIKDLREKKKQATVSASGSSPPPRAKPKSVSEMTDEEMEAHFEEEAGSDYRG